MTSERHAELPNGWRRCALPEFTRIVMGQSPPSTTYNHRGDGLPFYQGKGEFGDLYPSLNQYCSEPNKVAKQGAVLLSVRAPVGPTNIAQRDCCIGRGLAAIHSAGGLAPKFLLYLFRSIEPVLAGKGTGSTFKAITKGFVEGLEFNLPPLPEQDRIVAKIEEVFSELDKGVESLKTARAYLNAYRQAVLKHAFEGTLTAQWRAENKEELEKPEELLARIKQERKAHHERQLQEWRAAIRTWEDSGEPHMRPPKPKKPLEIAAVSDDADATLPQLPESWLWVRLGSISDVSGGLTKNQQRNSLARKMKYLRVANVYSDKILTHDVYTIGVTERDAKRVALEVGDLLIVEGNGSIDQIGRVAVWKGELPACGHQNHLIRVRLATKSVPRFFLHFLLSPLGRDLIVKASSSTSGLNTLSISKVSNLLVPVASSAEEPAIVIQIEGKLAKVDEALEEVETQLARSKTLRQSILKKAFAGQLVEQDPSDDPASVLLERIRTEKEQAGKTSRETTRRTGNRRTSA